MRNKSESYKKYLDPSVVSSLSSLELKAKSVVEGFMVGLHKSPYHGFSVEFSEHRPYMQGDPIKNIDWKVFGKSEKYFIKQFEEETNLISNIILDNSGSMDYKHEGSITKLEYGKILAASFAHILLMQQDSVGLSVYSDKIEKYFPPKSSRVYLKTLFEGLENIVPQKKTNTAAALNELAEKIKRRGLVIVISDFFDSVESVMGALKHFHYKKNEIIIFQILDPVEINFAFKKDSVFIDKETGEEISTQPLQIRKAYNTALTDFLSEIKSGCQNYRIDYNLIDTSTGFDKALLAFFKKRSRLN